MKIVIVGVLLGAWKKLLECEQNAIVELALEKPELSPRELAVTFIHTKAHMSQNLLFIGY